MGVADLDKSLFVRRAFDVLDESETGTISFEEFVIGVWNYCTLDQSALVLFAFDMCDLDNTGTGRVYVRMCDSTCAWPSLLRPC